MRYKRRLTAIILILFFMLMPFKNNAYADLPVVDFVNAALNELRNSLMQDQFTQQIVVFFDQLSELENTYQEIIRFNSGIEEFIRNFVGGALNSFNMESTSAREVYLLSLEPSRSQDAIRNLGYVLDGEGEPAQIKSYLDVISGPDPGSEVKPYITFDESEVGSAYLLAHEIRKKSDETKKTAEAIQDAAASASPKGAVRLTADGVGKMLVLTQENQEALAKLIELEATQIEQTNRDEKRFEEERISFMDDMKTGTQTLGRPA